MLPFLALLVGVATASTANSQKVVQEAILGTWRYTAYIYQNETHPPRNPNLKLIYTFTRSGISSLSWFHSDREEYCERWAIFTQSLDDVLKESVFFIRPESDSGCSSDPDMQLGRVTWVHFSVDDTHLYLNEGLGNERLIYVFTRQRR